MINLMIFIIVVLQFILIVQFTALMTYIKNARTSTDYRLDNLVHRMEHIESNIESIQKEQHD